MLTTRQFILKFLYFIISIRYSRNSLLYPQFTVIQLIGSISVPVIDLPSNRKVFFDWGLQMNYDMPYNISSFSMVPIWATSTSGRNLLFNSRGVNQHDFTAKELYDGLENMLERYGYDKSCLMQSICDLSQHPFDDSYKNVLIDVINFFLKPSIHQGFLAEEKNEETLYRLAEDQGFLGKDCQELYPACVNSLFNILTVTDFIES